MDNFWDRVSVGTGVECWPWTGPLDKDGYGRYAGGKRGVRLSAHRVAYRLANGSIDADKVVMHSCDNPRCCNPAHLSLGTQAENLRDMHAKRRHPGTKLTQDAVRAIRSGTDNRPVAAIAKQYGVVPGTVYFAKKGLNWAGVG